VDSEYWNAFKVVERRRRVLGEKKICYFGYASSFAASRRLGLLAYGMVGIVSTRSMHDAECNA
jgi:hypothetical protein